MLENFFSEKVTYQSPLSPQEIEQKLNEVVETNPLKLVIPFVSLLPYYGQVEANIFRFHPRKHSLHWLNVHGETQAVAGGSVINMTLEFNMFLRAWLLLFFSFITMMLLITIISFIGSLLRSAEIFPILVVLFLWVIRKLPGWGFQALVAEDRAFFQELFEAELVANE